MKRFFKYIIPSILSMWVYAFYTMVDGFFVANYCGELEFSAVNISMPIVTSFFALGILFSIGTQALVAYSLGKGDFKRANEIFTTSIVSVVGVGLIYTILLYIFLDKIIYILGGTDLTHGFVKEYLKTIIPFGIFFMTTYQLEVLVKVDGFPNISAISVVCAALTNLILDYIFIVPLKWGLFGASFATGIAQVVSTVLLISHFFKKRGKINFSKSIDFNHLKKTIPLGVGDAMAEVAIAYTVFLFNTTLLRNLGKDGIVMYTVISYISIFATVTMTGVSQGLSPLFSYDNGRNNIKSIKKLLRWGFISIFMLSVIFIIVAKVFPGSVVDLFLDSTSSVLDKTAVALSKYSTAYIFIGINILSVALFASLGKGKFSMLISLLRTPVSISIVMAIYNLVFKDDKIWYVLAISEGLTAIVSLIILKKKVIDKWVFEDKKSD